MSQKFAVVYENNADSCIATELADRVLLEAINWLDEHLLLEQREWIAELPGNRRLTWTGIKKLAEEARIRPHGHFRNKQDLPEPRLPDAVAARRALLYLLKEAPDLKAVVMIRDQDDQPDRREGLRQARAEHQSGFVIVIGLAVVERECWVLSGFDPLDKHEQSQLDAEQRQLGFDPRLTSQQLTHKNDTGSRSAKRVLRALTNGDWDRERRCWNDPTLAILRNRGMGNGLADYLQEVRNRLAPLIGHVPDAPHPNCG